jgi:hypothetical protein
LEQLELQRARITDAGVDTLKVLKELRALDLDGPGITDVSVPYLLGMSKLQYLNVGYTGASQGSVRRLLTLPGLKRFVVPAAVVQGISARSWKSSIPTCKSSMPLDKVHARHDIEDCLSVSSRL